MSQVGFKVGRPGGVLHTLDRVTEFAPIGRCGEVIEVAQPAPLPGQFKRWCRMCSLPADEIEFLTASLWRRAGFGLVPTNGFRPAS
ncbi:hypothetical protein OG599_09145 [Streptomyces sp. NBC_01335]|uniref:hypothetical protein n=1 Tax=Streptomyces sp. NBC_01335 TaxID=2903828 RepID=UPI002E108A60|nr:hypothetical protein OG599_09145 [Streptomyces sp. NBC_01335]